MSIVNKWLTVSVIFISTAWLCGACKKNTTEPSTTTNPISTERGLPQGEPIEKVIGASGGTLESPDKRIRIMIPPGAVGADTKFTIQPVTKTLEAATGTVYRLGPDETTFQKDITLTFNYGDEEISGAVEDDLYLSYQDNRGVWTRVVMTNIDKNKRILTATTRHFSDWAVERIFYIDNIKKKTMLQAKEEAGLIVFWGDTNEKNELVSWGPVPIKNIDGWFVHGAGKFDRTNMEAVTYIAPDNIPAPATVEVGVRIKNMVNSRHPERPGNGGLAIVQIPLQLIPEEFFTWEIDGSAHVSLANDAALLGTTTNLLGTAATGSVSLWLNAAKPGTYDQGSAITRDNFSIQVSLPGSEAVIYLGTYYECNEPVPQYGKGKLTITKFGSIGDFIEGHFTANVYARVSDCQNKNKFITGTFKLRRKA